MCLLFSFYAAGVSCCVVDCAAGLCRVGRVLSLGGRVLGLIAGVRSTGRIDLWGGSCGHSVRGRSRVFRASFGLGFGGVGVSISLPSIVGS